MRKNDIRQIFSFFIIYIWKKKKKQHYWVYLYDMACMPATIKHSWLGIWELPLQNVCKWHGRARWSLVKKKKMCIHIGIDLRYNNAYMSVSLLSCVVCILLFFRSTVLFCNAQLLRILFNRRTGVSAYRGHVAFFLTTSH